jgi:hypothetical protein
MQGLMSVLPFVDDLETTLDRVSYGEPLTTGQGMTTALRPEAKGMVELATMFAPGGRFAKDAAVSALKSTKGFPVGMSIKDIGTPQEAATTAGKTARALGNLPVKPSTDDAGQVMDATFQYGALGGKKTMPIDMLSGGVRMNDPKEAERVRKLAEQMSGPEGYISRLVVDDAGNVLEGQHRLAALQMLGQKNVPVTVVKDLSLKYNTEAMEQALAGSMRRDQVKQMVQNAIEALEDSGSVEKALQEYVMPPKFQKQFESVLRASQREN